MNVSYACYRETCERILTRRTTKSKFLSPKCVKKLGVMHTSAVENLMDEPAIELFGEIDVEETLARSFLSLGIETEDGELVGVIIVNDYPNIPAIPSFDWTGWLHNQYGLEELYSRNTLWFHLIAFDIHYTFTFFKPLVYHIFQSVHYLEHIPLVVPSTIRRLDYLDAITTRVLPKEYEHPQCVPYILLASRSEFIKAYKIRRAVEEDNDDLVPLIDTHSKLLRELYGDFYIAEILTRHKDTGRQIIVAEYGGQAVGVVCLSPEVNYGVLNEEFELTPYHGLKKRDTTVDLYELIREYEGSNSRLSTFSFEIANTEELMGKPVIPVSIRQPPTPHTIDKDLKADSEATLVDEVFQDAFTKCSSDEDDYSIVLTSSSLYSFQDLEEDMLSIDDDTEYKSNLYTDYLLEKEKNFKVQMEMDANMKRLTDTSRYDRVNSRLLNAPDNAFTLEIVAAYPDHEQCIRMLFEAAFECYPDREYCVLAVPPTSSTTLFNKFFNRVPPKPGGTFPDSLHVLHRCTIRTKLEVVEARDEHSEQIRLLLLALRDYYAVEDQYRRYLKGNSGYDVYVMLGDGQVVGIAVLSEEQDVDYLNSHYDIMPWINTKVQKSGNSGLIENCLLTAQFHTHSKFFIKELHRLSDFSVLYYKIATNDAVRSTRNRPLANILPYLIPVTPRIQPEYDVFNLKDTAPDEVVLQETEPAALFISTITHCSIPRLSLNQRIVVVGSSNTSLAFLESLLWSKSPHYLLLLNNVTLVCPAGLLKKLPPKVRQFVIKRDLLENRSMNMLYLKTFVNTVNGIMTAIDRKEQYITINDNCYLPYDYLFLMCGEQFQRPIYKPNQDFPENVVVLNSSYEITKITSELQNYVAKTDDGSVDFIIYGHYLQAHCAIACLLEYGKSPKEIIFIEPFPRNSMFEGYNRPNIALFNNPKVDEAVMQNLRGLGVTVYESYYFIDWNYDVDSRTITSARFESQHRMIELELACFVIFHRKCISPKTFQAISNAGLVFDGRLVIDAECKTNDPRIYGAGPMTKYSRKYYANHLIHKYFNREEVGRCLGRAIKKMLIPSSYHIYEDSLDPQVFVKKKTKEAKQLLVPTYKDPLIHYCRLVGGLYYLSVCKPGLQIPLQTATSRKSYGSVLVTGDCKSLHRQGYFRLHLNQFNTVETITCLAKFPLNVMNLISLWGKHEQMLNNLLMRYEMVLITDLFEYFRQPWTYAIYNDRFPLFTLNLDEILCDLVDGDTDKLIIDDMIDAYRKNRWKELPVENQEDFHQIMLEADIEKILTEKLIEFLQSHSSHLPMYAVPHIIRRLLHGYDASPLFRK